MVKATTKSPPVQKKFATTWAELDYVCRKVDYWLHVRNDRTAARRYQIRLQRLLHELRDNKTAILREEGLALSHELSNDVARAIHHRKREIQLIERLHNSVQKSVVAGEYDDSMAKSIIGHRDAVLLRERRALQHDLERNQSQLQNAATRNGQNGHRPRKLKSHG